MRLLPKSLTGRLVATAAVAIAAALILAAFAIGHVLEHFVMRGLDDRLDAQIAVAAAAVRPDGSFDDNARIDVPPFDTRDSDWAWQVDGPGGTRRSASLGGNSLPLPPDWRPPPAPSPPPPADADAPPPPIEPAMDHPRPLDGWDRNGRPLHYRILTLNRPRGTVTIMAAGPRRIVDRPLAAAMTPLLVSLLLLGLFLAFALIVQVRVGLRPLQRLRDHLAAVRAGSARRIDVAEPTELLPLVAEINALIEANDQAVARARGHVANLAHGLKTPLATLRLDLAERDPTGALRAQVERMEGQIRHHLGRARAAESSSVAAALELEPRLADLVTALGRIHADRAITSQLDIEPDLHVRCDPQDLDELLGNLLDNGWRHARQLVRITARRQGRMARIEIGDDGPGMRDAEIAEALKGLRLDERGGGHGFGLSIARELAELHGGAIDLAHSDLGGLAAVVELPAI